MSRPIEKHEFIVIEPGKGKAKPNKGEIRLGIDVKVSLDRLREYLAKKLTSVDLDLLLLSGVVARVDRMVKRHLATRWSRSLHVKMCVHDPELWSQEAVLSSLREALNLLTGDEWTFSFLGREKDEQALQLDLFPHAPTNVATMPYSGGLDSYSGLANWEPNPKKHRLLVHTRNSQASRGLVHETLRGQPVHHVSLPVRLPKLPNAEPTYRSRTFMFLAAAAVAARLGEGSDIVVAENGQGALGPALVRFNGEHPYYSTHPIFTRRMGDFLHELWQRKHKVTFHHPAVWQTKGEVLASLVASNGIPRWKTTRSCSRANARNKGTGAPSQCGVCGGCLLRRVALDAAGLAAFGTNPEGYLWADLGAEIMQADKAFNIETTANDRRIAVHAIISMAGLGDFTKVQPDDPSVLTLAEDLAYGVGISVAEAQNRVQRLIKAHQAEWATALEKLPRSSWLRRVAEERV